MSRRTFRLTALLLILVALFAVFAAPAAAQSTSGSWVAYGNDNCPTGYGIKLEGPGDAAGTYWSYYDGYIWIEVTITGSGTFNWTSHYNGIDAVNAKGGPGNNWTYYNPEAFSGSNVTNTNPSNGQPFGNSHITFCWDYELTASKTADATYTRTYTWTINKTVDDNSHTGFTGDSFTSNYDVIVVPTVDDSNYAVSGIITVNNPTPLSVSFSVSDSVGGTPASVDCGGVTSLNPGALVICTYSASVGGPVNGTNTATITSNTAGVNGTTASAGYTFGAPTTTVGYPTINVTDTLGGNLGSASGYTTFEYSVTFTCDADEGANPNTATIVETGQQSSANVDVACYELSVNKDAATSLTRTWTWDIEKTGDQTDLTLATGQSFLVNYEVVVSALSADSNWAVTGNITVNNPAPIPAVINSVSDIISPAIGATVDCGVLFPYALGPSSSLNCTYTSALPDASNRLNTATATLQNYASGVSSGTTGFSGTANVSFASPTVTQVDECINVSDNWLVSLGTVCADQLPKTYTYALTVGPYAVCGDYTFTNIASFVTTDTASIGSDDHVVNINVPCAGCTLTQGYWKTHSLFGPAPYDDSWLLVGPNGAATPFFFSGMTWYEVFWTAPAGNAFYNLAHQYMAAKLNILNGAATTPAVTSAISAAEGLFGGLPAGSTTLTNAQTRNARNWASTLDQYNNGLIGPGHCDE